MSYMAVACWLLWTTTVILLKWKDSPRPQLVRYVNHLQECWNSRQAGIRQWAPVFLNEGNLLILRRNGVFST